MACKVIRFDNGYMFYLNGNYLTDKNEVYIASFDSAIQTLGLNSDEMTDVQIWELCKPAIQSAEFATKRERKKFKEQLLQLFNLKGDE